MNALPDDVQNRIETMMQGVSLERLGAFATKLSAIYRDLKEGQKNVGLPPLKSYEDHLAYISFRLPATYAALLDVFSRINAQPASLLDLGAGPGTSFLAAVASFDTIKTATLVERDPIFIDIGKKLIGNSFATWVQSDFDRFETKEQFDLVTISYALGELSAELFQKVVDFALQRTKATGHLVLIEPGTPRGYETIIRARSQLLRQGASCVAPCPHNLTCPILKGDWCHFSTRLPRSRLHRNIKGVERGFEDEKFSYVVVASQSVHLEPCDRVIREPLQRSGHVLLTLCTHEGAFEQKTVSRKNKESFLLAKKAEWGDKLEIITN